MTMSSTMKGNQTRYSPRSKLAATVLSLPLVLSIGLVDYVTGYEARAFLLYFIPVAMATWFVGRGYGVVVACACSLVWAVADILARKAYPVTGHLFWNCGIQFAVFIFVALALSRIAADLDAQEKSNSDLGKEKAKLDNLVNAFTQDLDMARIVQRTMIPQSPPQIAALDVAIEYRPAIQIGGDVLNIYPLDKDRTLFFLGDAMGHGIQAALVMAAINAVTRRSVYADPNPPRVLTQLNNAVFGNLEAHIVTAACCLVDTRGGTATLAIAGHPKPLLVRNHGSRVEEVGKTNLPLGVQENAQYEDMFTELAPGDTFVFYTDGMLEAKNAEGERYGYTRLREQVCNAAGMTPQEISNRLIEHVLKYSIDPELQDDVAILVIKTRSLREEQTWANLRKA